MIQLVILLGFFFFSLLLLATGIVHFFVRVPYVPSRKKTIERMVKAASLKDKEKVYDLGCGDGRLLCFAASKKKIKGIGYEIAPFPYVQGKIKHFLHSFSKDHNTKHVSIQFKNFFNEKLKKADVVFTYLSPNILPDLADKLKKECKKGTRVISNTFQIPGLKLIKKLPRNKKHKLQAVFHYEI
jgi:SAM-dependent methyltransferase